MCIKTRLRYRSLLSILIGTLSLLSLLACKNEYASLKEGVSDQQLQKKGIRKSPYTIVVDVKSQSLHLLKDKNVIAKYPISTSRRGLGEKINSYQTPKGVHQIVEKIGDKVPEYGIFHRRQYLGKVWQPQPHEKHRKDFIVTRVLRLKGLEKGLNAGKNRWGQNVDSEERAIYIHGTTMEWLVGKPTTKGCIHMKSRDVVDLFNRVPTGTLVLVVP